MSDREEELAELERWWERRLARHVRTQATTGREAGGRMYGAFLVVVVPAIVAARLLPGPTAIRVAAAAAWIALVLWVMWSRSYRGEKRRYLRRRDALLGRSDDPSGPA